MGEVAEHRSDRPSSLAAAKARGGLLVEGKLHVPAARPEWVPRERLVRDLTVTAARLVLVAAPAGFGKTILVAQWSRAVTAERPFAWVSLDRGDNDPGRLWWHVVSGLQRAWPDLARQNLLRYLRTRAQGSTEELLPRLVNALAGLSRPAVLVLDDFHLVTEPRCREQIEFLLLHLAPPAEMVIITRAVPPLPLARLRAAGDLTEIGMRHLRLTPDEAAMLVHRLAAVRLSDRELAELSERTEGWPAGIYLAALSLRGRRDPGACVRRLRGSTRYIADYLYEEVISGQPDRVRRFLTRTAILGRLTAPLCEAVTETAGAAGIIDVLTRENLFIVPLDDSRQWFRYHHLFRHVLREELGRSEPGLVPALHRRASAWHAAHGSAEEAIEHALAGGDFPAAADLLARHWAIYVNAGRARTVRRWIAALGDDQVTANPLTAHVAAWVAALSGEPETVRRLLPVIEAGRDAGRLPDGMRSLEFSAALLRGTVGFDGIRAMRTSAARAAELEDDPTAPWYPLALAALGFSRYLSGEPGTEEQLSRALDGEAADPMVQLLALAAATLAAAAQRARLESLRRRLWLRSGPTAPTGPLTKQEAAVLRLLRTALSVREIGQQLHVSRNTAKSHMRAIYRKLGVSSRDEAVARGRELGYG